MLVHRLRCAALCRPLALVICLLVMAQVVWPLAPARAAADATLILEPNGAPCTGRVVARGSGFPPGQAIALVAFRPGGGSAIVAGRTTVPADGTFALPVEVQEFAGPCDGGAAQRDGTRFIINAVIDRGESLGGPLATATFTLSSSAPSPPGLPNTGDGGLARRSRPLPWGLGLALLLLTTLGGAYRLRSASGK